MVGQIGLGQWGKNILRNLCNLKVLHTAVDINDQTLKNLIELYKDVIFTNSIDDVLKNDEIKAVVISTPAKSHYEIAKKALLNDKDVFVEKPLALTYKEGQELVELAEKKQKILMVGHLLNYHPAVIKLKELVSSGKLGEIQYIYSNRLNIGKIRTEENVLWSFAPHDISIIINLLNEEPTNVNCFGQYYINKNIYDVTLTILEFSQKVRAHIFVSWLHPYKEQKLVVVGSQAMAVFDDQSTEKLTIYPHKIENKNGIVIEKKAPKEIIEIDPLEPLKLELEHFIECINTRKPPLTDGKEALRVLKVLEEAQKKLYQNISKELKKELKESEVL